ncbi:helix-turn-helix domain-containing protein [Streptococcus sp. FT1-55]|uniref:helix-turn-helix domain-containing protein n=1 Tax=Streptococcus sp. FT1-55 TaxID=3409805 RepID=UPI003BF50363
MINKNIKKARLESGLTQKQVADSLGVAQAQYARWESGGRNPKDDTISQLAEIFGVGIDTLKGRDDGLEDIVELLRKNPLSEGEKAEIIRILNNFLSK